MTLNRLSAEAETLLLRDAVYDVRPEQYPTVIREMIRHENDLTNHRIMWLLVGQGFIAKHMSW